MCIIHIYMARYLIAMINNHQIFIQGKFLKAYHNILDMI